MENTDNLNDDLRVIKLTQHIKKNTTVYRYATILGILGALFGIVFTTISLLHVKDTQNVTMKSLNTNIQIIDSMKTKEALNARKIDSIREFTLEFLKAKRTESVIYKYYAPVLDLYYQKTKVPVEYIIKNRKRFTNVYPRQKQIFSKNDIDVVFQNNNIAEITASGLFYPDSTGKSTEIIYKIKIYMDSKKVFYVNNFTPHYPPL